MFRQTFPCFNSAACPHHSISCPVEEYSSRFCRGLVLVWFESPRHHLLGGDGANESSGISGWKLLEFATSGENLNRTLKTGRKSFGS